MITWKMTRGGKCSNNQPDLWNRWLGSLFLLLFFYFLTHNEVMKQQVWPARRKRMSWHTAKNNKKNNNFAMTNRQEKKMIAKVTCSGLHAFFFLTFLDSTSLGVRLWKWQTTPRLQKQASEEIPAAAEPVYNWQTVATTRHVSSPFGRGN